MTRTSIRMTRDGVMPIKLIEVVELGVRPKQVFEIDHAFFDEFRLES